MCNFYCIENSRFTITMDCNATSCIANNKTPTWLDPKSFTIEGTLIEATPTEKKTLYANLVGTCRGAML